MYWQEETAGRLRDLLSNCRLVGLVTDMDGTISPIVARPEDAYVTERNRALLERLRGQLVLVAVVSGRPVEDLRARVGLAGLVYVGSHGLERWVDKAVAISPEALRYTPRIREVGQELAGLPKRFPGTMLEDKGLSLAVHYRNTVDPDAVFGALRPEMQQLAAARGLKLMEGRKVFEFQTPLKIDKGVILRRLVEEYRLDGVLYLGDDTTDVDAMREVRSLREEDVCRGLSIGVLSAELPQGLREAADLLATGVPDVEGFLSWLCEVIQADR